MIQQSTFSFNRRQRVSAIRDFPHGCGTQFRDQTCHRPKEDEWIDLVKKKAGYNAAASGNVGIRRLVSAKRTFPPSSDCKAKPLSREATIELQRKRKRHSESFGNSHQQRMQIQRKLPEKMSVELQRKRKRHSESFGNRQQQRMQIQRKLPKKMSYVVAARDERRSNQGRAIPVKQPNNQTTRVASSARKRVLKVLREFKNVYRELDRGKAARRGESRVDCQTRNVLVAKNKQVNGVKRIGAVPGIEIEDEFQYKSEMNLIGLHFCIMGGIDYLSRGEFKLATSIVSSEGEGYNDKLESDVVIYTGEGGHVTNKDQKNMVEDQKLVKGNLALANSMKEQSEVRVIRGLKRGDQKGKHYIYDGLYLVKDYWQQRGHLGNMVFKFKLCRIPGQPPIDWAKHIDR